MVNPSIVNCENQGYESSSERLSLPLCEDHDASHLLTRATQSPVDGTPKKVFSFWKYASS
jgi:hypothetical protein